MEKKYDVNDEMEIDLKELFFELLNNWVMIVTSMVLVALIAFCVSKFIMVPQYQSTSELYVFSKGVDISNLVALQTGTNLTNDYIVVITDRPVLEQVIKNLDLEESYGALKGKITINNPTSSRILQITVTDTDPQRAKLIADEVANVSALFIEEKMEQDKPNVISYGYSDGGAVSPNVKMNTVLGAAIGAFLAMAIVIVSYLMNDTIMSAEDIERKLGLNVLGTLPLEEEYDGAKKKKVVRSLPKMANTKASGNKNVTTKQANKNTSKQGKR